MAIKVQYCHSDLGKFAMLIKVQKIVKLAMAIKVKYCHWDLGEFAMLIKVNLPWKINSKTCHGNKVLKLPWGCR